MAGFTSLGIGWFSGLIFRKPSKFLFPLFLDLDTLNIILMRMWRNLPDRVSRRVK